MLTKTEVDMDDERRKLVEKGVPLIGRLETRLHTARADLAALEGMLKQGYRLGMINGTECMVSVSKAARMAGAIAAIEEELYPFHARITELAKAAGVDMGGPYAVLTKYAPPAPRDSGGSR